MTIPPVVNGSAGHHARAHKPDRRQHPVERFIFWWIAVVDTKKKGLSLTRLLAVFIAYATFHIAHDWIRRADTLNIPLGWPFVGMVSSGFMLSVCTAFGGKYIMALVQTKMASAGLLPVEGK